ncbi:hypothetical protein [Uliginosibacterium sp. 31-12]|uniref:hypothetical protein n=1 Tax=Uliginosibacterium sp. 31-12 TaxID=3062781 RepID=UPI0026E24B9F|nr:hypothetical protein [Uliginosibacterium sp. 31-12]MDO6388051.1 hypothetical protein [Uliginosibacterium sp. 31-12]
MLGGKTDPYNTLAAPLNLKRPYAMITNQEEKAVELVRKIRVDRDPVDISVKHKMEGFDGTLYFVHWKSNKEGKEYDTISFFGQGDPDGVFLWQGEDAIKYFSKCKLPTTTEKVARFAFRADGVTAIIAFLIVVTICFLAVTGKADTPAVLANALTSVLAFFFGSKVNKKE